MSDTPKRPRLSRSIVSLRVWHLTWADDERFNELVELVRDFRDVIEEVALFSSSTHAPLPLAELESRAALMGRRLVVLKTLGVRVGINHLATIGHHNEDLDHALAGPFERMVDKSGTVSLSVPCVSDPAVQDYIRRSYEVFAAAGPEFIWVDDDLRMESHGVAIDFACFCPRCLAEFGTAEGVAYSRESLLAVFKDKERGPAVRKRWLGRNRRYFSRMLGHIREGVDRVDKNIVLGLMTADTVYSGYGFGEWLAALAGPGKREVKFRPGGGFYDDGMPVYLISKMQAVGRQNSLVPSEVTDIQYEHENFPYLTLSKSRAVFNAEIAGAIGAGCTGVALNCMTLSGDPIGEFRPWIEGVRGARGFFDAAASTLGRSPCEGIWNAFGPDHNAALAPGKDWPGPGKWGNDLQEVNELFTLGLPPAYSREASAVTLLVGDGVLEWSKEELTTFLSGGVLLDGPALQRLAELGLAGLAGWSVAGSCETDIVERFTDDPLNGRFGGWHRDCRPSFWPKKTWLLQPAAENARALAEARDLGGRMHGCCAGVFENPLGGRVAVMGYYPWSKLGNLAKTSQLRSVVNWLGRDRLPATVDSFHRIALWCRRDAEGRPAFMVINASIDPAEGVILRVRGSDTAYQAMDMRGGTTRLTGTADGENHQRLRMPAIAPWSSLLVRAVG